MVHNGHGHQLHPSVWAWDTPSQTLPVSAPLSVTPTTESCDLSVQCHMKSVYAANKIIHNKQITITWNVDDLKVYHSDNDIVDVFIKWIKETYEDTKKLNPPRGKYMII